MADQPTILPCPFCGAQPVVEPWHGAHPDTTMIGCQNDAACHALPNVVGDTKEEAIARWNQRPRKA